LNFTRGLISLHALLASNDIQEITVPNYIQQYEWEYKTKIDPAFKREIEDLSKQYKDIYEVSFRHKIAAHISMEFKHTDFTNAYMLPSYINKYLLISKKLKRAFFIFIKYQQNDDPFYRINIQAKSIIDEFR
jgi:hypothetical protein